MIGTKPSARLPLGWNPAAGHQTVAPRRSPPAWSIDHDRDNFLTPVPCYLVWKGGVWQEGSGSEVIVDGTEGPVLFDDNAALFGGHW